MIKIRIIKKAIPKKVEPLKTTDVYTVQIARFSDNSYHSTLKKNNKKIYELQYQIEGTPFCCGLSEVGSFYERVNSLNELERKKVDELILKTFERIIDKDDDDHEIVSIFTLINDDGVCNRIKNALGKHESWKIIREFVNSNTGNTNVIYMSQ